MTSLSASRVGVSTKVASTVPGGRVRAVAMTSHVEGLVCTLSSIDVFRVDGRMPTMTCTAVAVQQTVDRTPRGVFNRPF